MIHHHLFLSIIIIFTTLSCAVASLSDADQQLLLAKHNAARASVGVGPLVWNKRQTEYAEAFVVKFNNCMRTLNPILSGGPYGENTASGFDTENGLAGAVDSWVKQGNYYNYSTDACICGGHGCAAYRQVVWRNTVRLGCAIIPCENTSPSVLCEYDPPENVPGEKPY